MFEIVADCVKNIPTRNYTATKSSIERDQGSVPIPEIEKYQNNIKAQVRAAQGPRRLTRLDCSSRVNLSRTLERNYAPRLMAFDRRK